MSGEQQARTPEKFTCPKCGAVSYHQMDIIEGYCGNCHTFPEDRRREAAKEWSSYGRSKAQG